MAAWRIELFGHPRILREGQPVRLRTAHQLLLLAQLAMHHPGGLGRREAAARLWPDASPPNRATYLRRALMELRQAGLPVLTEGSQVGIDWTSTSCDLLELKESTEGEMPGEDALLQGMDHAIAEAAREMWRDHRASRMAYGESALPGPDKLRLWLAERMIEEEPAAVLKVLTAHGAEMIYNKPTEGLLDLYLEVLEKAGTGTTEALKVRLYAAHVAGTLTRYSLSKKLLLEVIEEAEATGHGQEEASAYGALAHISGELHDFESAMQYGQFAIDKAMAIDNPRSASGAMINLGHIYGQQLRYAEAVGCFHRAFELAESIGFDGQKSVALASLAFYWGVLRCEVSPEILDQATKQAALGYMAMVDAYTQFSLAVGHADAMRAGTEAQAMLRLTTTEGMERMLYVALDNCAIALAMAGRPTEAAVVVRTGTRYRRNFQGGRSPVEKQVIRRHVKVAFFGQEIERVVRAMPVTEPGRLAEEIGGLLE